MATAAYLATGVIDVPGMTAELSGYSLKTRSTPASRVSPDRGTGRGADERPRLPSAATCTTEEDR